jgi:hypothetical protein
MKKLAIGCLVVLVVFAVVGGIGAYWMYNKAKGMVSSLSQLQEIPKVEAQVQNKAEFTAPGNGELSGDQVARYMAVQKTIKDRLGARLTDLDAKYKALNGKNEGAASFGDGIDALKDLGSLVLEAKKVQVDALNAQRFSLAEYSWTRRSVYQAAGVPLSVDFEQVIRSAQAGQTPTKETMTEAVTGPVPDKNKELVAPHVEALRENAGLAFFGL